MDIEGIRYFVAVIIFVMSTFAILFLLVYLSTSKKKQQPTSIEQKLDRIIELLEKQEKER
ncbi:DUF4083 family protein [Bacillus sp. CGMCC 1.16541]|uniref:DUF4083 family protein n=1 Tax=Bacillus sp. CGMCC 1.16541 TaxID=2185143 RepID=UPI000D728333|nr:DUF4083 family protein [Bacillus sp. CGMCC 1.16541]